MIYLLFKLQQVVAIGAKIIRRSAMDVPIVGAGKCTGKTE